MKWTTSMSLLTVIALSCFPTRGYAADVPIVSPEAVADYVYAVVESRRAFYTTHVVQPLEEQGVICPTSCITFTMNGEEEDLRGRLNAPAPLLSQDLYVSSPLPTKRVMVKDENVCLHSGL